MKTFDPQHPPTSEEVEAWKKRIDDMGHFELAEFYRFSPAGNAVMCTPALWDYFMARFNRFGGMTPTISKQIGLDP